MHEERNGQIAPEHEDELLAAAEREASDLAVARGVYRPTPDSLPGYKIIREIGRGGMGVVYEAEQEQPHRAVALKLIRGAAFADEHRLKLFEREVETLARLQHPGIAAIHEAGRTKDGYPFFTMELVRGIPLTEHVRRAQLPLAKRLALFRAVCEAVNYAHQRGVIHRDLKPSNILVDAEGNRKILDFGLARLMRANADIATASTLIGSIAGTLPYMSPEQARGCPAGLDTRTDVYSLGVILYEVMTGKLPYDLHGAMLHEAVKTICEQAPERPSTIDRVLRGDIETIALKTLEKEPARRYQSASALSDDIGRYVSGQPILAHPPSAVYQLRKLAARHKLPVALAVALLLVTAAFAILGTVQAVRIAEQRDRVAAVNELFRELLRAVGLSVTASTSADTPLTQAEVVQLLRALEDKIASTFPADMELNAEARASLAAAFVNLRMYEEAEEQARAALALRQDALGQQHPVTLSALMDLGWILLQARGMRLEGKVTEAEAAFQAAYDGLLAAVGEEHPETLKAAQYLALSLYLTEKYEQSQALLRRTLELQRRILGDASPETLWSLNLLARRLTRLGSVTEGEGLAREALRSLAHGTGAESAHALVLAMNWLVEALEAQGRYAAAMVVRRQMIAVRERTYGPADPVAQHIRSGLAFLLVRTGQYDQGEPTLRDILGAQRVLLGSDHVYTRFTLNYLARSLNLHGRFEEAEPLCREGMESCQRLSGDDHPLTLSFTIGLTTAWRGLGRLEDAAALYRQAAKALAGRPKLYFPLVRAELQYYYGVCLTDLGHYDEAEAELLAAYEGEARIRGEDHEATRRCIESLIALYGAWSKPDKAAEYRALLTPAETIASAAKLAESLIRESGAAKTIIDHLESDLSLPEAVRTRALRHVHNHLRDTETSAAVYWWFLRSPDVNAATYQAALEQAREACRLEPENGAYLRNLGAALYRVGAYEEALAALRRADEANSTQAAGSHPADVAFIAMACQQRGLVEDARAELDRLRQLMENAEHAGSEELQALSGEAEPLIIGKAPESGEKNGG